MMINVTKIKDWVYDNPYILFVGGVLVILAISIHAMVMNQERYQRKHDGLELVCWGPTHSNTARVVFPAGNGLISYDWDSATYYGRGIRYKMNNGETCAIRRPL